MKLNIGETIKRLRKEREITQEEFSEILGVSCQSVSRWENNSCYPDIELIPTIAAFFGVSTDKLMGIDEVTEKSTVDRYLNDFQAAISIFEKIYVLDELMYDGKPYIGTHSNSKTNYHIAKLYLRLNKNDEAMKHLKIAAQAAIAFDNRPYERKTVSFLLGEQIDKKTDFDTADSRPLCKILRDTWLKDKEFDKIRDTDEFIRIIESLS